MVINTIFLAALITSVTAIPSKRGLIIINSAHLQDDLPKYLASPQLQWVYNYSPQPAPNDVYGNLSFVPMLWGQGGSTTFFFTLKSGQRYDDVLSFNEPDMNKSVGGSDLSVDQAVSIWQTQIQPLKTLGYKLGSPAGIISYHLSTYM
jgi:Glycosyl hydrolase catalytic core